MKNYLSTTVPLGPLEGLGEIADTGTPFTTLNKVLSSAIGAMTIIAILFFVIRLIMAAYAHITSGGDKAKIEDARNRIVQALIGLTIAIAAIFLVSLIGYILRIDILNPGQLLQDLADIL